MADSICFDSSESIVKSMVSNPSMLLEILKDEIAEFMDDDSENDDTANHFKRKTPSRSRNRAYAIEEMNFLTDNEFTRMFRLSREAFNWLLLKITPIILAKPSLRHDYHSISKEIKPITRLAITLRWLAGGSYLDICFAFGISTGTFYQDNGVL
jgi:hypothetical protein